MHAEETTENVSSKSVNKAVALVFIYVYHA